MKKLLSVVLCIALLLSCVFVIPAAAETPAGLGRAYKFTFGKNEAKYAYTMSATDTYKGNEFTPFGPSAGDIKETSIFDASYKTVLDTASGASHDVLRVRSNGTSWLVPLTAEGVPFEMQPGKSYKFKIKAYNTVANNYSQLFVCGSALNVPLWYKYYERVAPTSSNGAYSATSFRPSGYPIINGGYGYAAGNERKYNGFVDEDTVNWGGLPSWTPGSNGTVEGTMYVPSQAEGNNYAYTDENGSTSFTFTAVDASGNPLTDETTGDPKTVTANNYFTLCFLGGTYSETLNAGTPEETTVSLPFTMDVESIEIWEDGYAPDIDMYVNGDVDNTILGADRGDLGNQLYIPYFEDDSVVFTGWYEDAACTQLVTESSVLGATVSKIYAGFAPKQTYAELDLTKPGYGSGTINYPTADDTDAKGSYYGSPDRAGWSFQKTDANGLHMYVQTKWQGGGNYVLADANGTPIIAQPNSKYEITVNYDVDLVDPEEVVLPENRFDKDDYEYTSSFASLSAGAGVQMAQRRSMTDKQAEYRIKDTDKVTHKESAAGQSVTFKFETGSMDNLLPFVCVYVTSGGLPKKYTAEGKEDGGCASGGTACTDYGFNEIIIKSVTVKCLTPCDLTLYVDGEVYDTVAAEDRDTYDWAIPYYEDDTKVFTGWYSDPGCTKIINTNKAENVDKFIPKAYAGFTTYRTSITMEPAKDNGENFMNLPLEGEDGTYLGNPTRYGYSYQGIKDNLYQFYSQMRWGQYAAFAIVDEYGNPFIAKPNTTYNFSIEYSVDDLVKASEVTLREDRFDIDDYTPSDGWVQISAGIGYTKTGMLQHKGLNADNFWATYKIEGEPERLTETTDGWATMEYSVTTGDMFTHNDSGEVTGEIVPIVMVSVQCAGLPYAYTADGQGYSQAMGGAGDPTWGYNKVSIRKIVVTEAGAPEEEVMYGDCDGNETIDTADLVELKKSLAGLIDSKAPGMDVDGNGEIDTADLVQLKKYLAGLIDVTGLGPQPV